MDHKKAFGRILLDAVFTIAFFAILAAAAVALHFLVGFLKLLGVPQLVVGIFEITEVVIAFIDALGLILCVGVTTYRLSKMFFSERE